MSEEVRLDRREFIKEAALASAVVVGAIPALGLAAEKKQRSGVEEVTPVEDLMREHGGLNRILLIYEEALRRFRGREAMNPALLKQSATIIRDFIESYHEKLEEKYLFPRLKKAGRLVGTVDTLLAQHQAGRRLTAMIIANSSEQHLENPSDVSTISKAMTQFIAMYRPHAAREDTVVFPEFKKLVSPKEYHQLGERFEAEEHRLFGKEGFEGVLGKIAEIEKALGIHDLSKFTPPA
jgi:hemerythrin-like domain-containing protein